MRKLFYMGLMLCTFDINAQQTIYNVQPPDLIYSTYYLCPIYQIKNRERLIRFNMPNLTQTELNNMIAGLQEELNLINSDCDKIVKANEEKLKEDEHQRSLPGARLGMTQKQVIEKTNWGKPESINRSTGRWGVHEQWVYGGGNYLYFENGKLTSIQN